MRKLLLLTCLLLLMVQTAAAQDATTEPTTETTSEATLMPTIEASAEATQEALMRFPGPGSYTVRQPYNDMERSYRVYIPESYSDEGEPFPLVLVLHGAGGSAAGTEGFTGFNELAETENFIVVYPDGVGNAWNDGRASSNNEPINDVRFLGDVVQFMQNTLTIDPLRVYATGFSMGGMMAYRLGCDLPNRFAAVGSVASTMPAYLIPNCTDTVPVPVIVFQGTDDAVVPWRGVPGAYLSAAQTIGFWGAHNNCSENFVVEALPNSDPDDYTVVVKQELADCDADVMLYGVYFGGHTWPGHPLDPQLGLGQTTNDIDATALTWEFFKAHTNTFVED